MERSLQNPPLLAMTFEVSNLSGKQLPTQTIPNTKTAEGRIAPATS